MVFSFRKRTIEIIYCRYGIEIEANDYNEALQKLSELTDWKLEKEEQGSTIQERYYIVETKKKKKSFTKEKEVHPFKGF